ncbi:VOC family protein [Mesorhizobium sp. CA15]|uniref:VOC family protein n=1 Tax=Mesorhizobium sp. CA15 TaxID=2876641 RepID=UPI001CD17DBF|nr:VOC family protein [Mesorhizobium sp. CA15]MBZ9866389.1 VOC family protein [Mesorhizobium sp. CA15]
MSNDAMSVATATESAKTASIEMKVEAIVIAVSDVDRAKSFYSRLGWRLDADFVVGNAFRVVQFTPPDSACSLQFGKGLTSAEPGSTKVIYLVVSDIEAARAELVARGVDASGVFHRAGPGQPPISGRDPEGRSYSSFATFSDPDGNGWLLQEITHRLPGREAAQDTTFSSSSELAAALGRAASAHGEHERRAGGQRDDNWPDWYAQFMVAEQTGRPLPT